MSDTATDAGDLVERKVTATFHVWQTPAPGPPGTMQVHRARRGEVVRVTAEEAARGDELGTLGPADANVTADVDPMASTEKSLRETAQAAGILTAAGTPVDPRAPGAMAAADLEDLEAELAASADDETLAGMTATQVVAYLNQHPDEVDRVEELEAERDQPRATVQSAIDKHRAAADEE